MESREKEPSADENAQTVRQKPKKRKKQDSSASRSVRMVNVQMCWLWLFVSCEKCLERGRSLTQRAEMEGEVRVA